MNKLVSGIKQTVVAAGIFGATFFAMSAMVKAHPIGDIDPVNCATYVADIDRAGESGFSNAVYSDTIYQLTNRLLLTRKTEQVDKFIESNYNVHGVPTPVTIARVAYSLYTECHITGKNGTARQDTDNAIDRVVLAVIKHDSETAQ